MDTSLFTDGEEGFVGGLPNPPPKVFSKEEGHPNGQWCILCAEIKKVQVIEVLEIFVMRLS